MKKNSPNKKILNILKNIPDQPGIYKFYNIDKEVIYVGKAKSLKSRIKQYFKKNYSHSTRTKKLVENIVDIKFIAVDSELEASILETSVIKQLQPKYNVIMKDDKNYIYIKITNEDFPRIQLVRKIEKDNAKYIGPKSARVKVESTLNLLKKIFAYRHCNLDIAINTNKKLIITNKTIKYPCLDYHINRCIGPCVGKCTIEEYKKIIQKVVDFLEGRGENVIKDLKEEMMVFANEKKFEKAARLRDKITEIEKLMERQKVSDPNRKDTDIINYIITHNKAYFNLFQIRDGKLIGQENFILSAESIDDNSINDEVLEAFTKQYYEISTDIPKEILIPHDIENKNELLEIIRIETNKKPKIIIPKIGDKNKLLEMSLNNARIYADRNKPSWQEESELTIKANEELQKTLGLTKKIKRIECYDISHLSGTETVGSMIVFENGAPKKGQYRKFILKTVKNKPDDYKSLKEILYRRISKIALKENTKDYKFKKARIKDQKEITKLSKNLIINIKKSNLKEYSILEKNEKIACIGAVKEHSEKIHEIYSLWSNKKEKNPQLEEKLIRNIIKSSKQKRLYLISDSKNKEYYLTIGFEEIKTNPEELKSNSKIKKDPNSTYLVYDKYKHKTDESFAKTPDLIIIDGGKGQLSAGKEILEKLNFKIPYISLAKKYEEIFIPNRKTSLILDKTNEALKLLQRARDEAHRFAISFQRKRRKFDN